MVIISPRYGAGWGSAPGKWVMRIMIVALTAAALAACASSGTRVDPAKVAKFERGVTTANQVQASLGPANGSSTLADGGLVLVYTYARYQTRPETFIPYVGMFVGGADTTTQTVSF